MKMFGFALSIVAAALVAISMNPVTVHARPQVNTQFKERYVNGDSDTPEAKKLAEAVKVVKCNVCHVGTKKADRNRYGQELAKLLKKNEKDKAKIVEALEKAEALKIDADDPKSKTYGDLLKAGELPGKNS